MIRRLAAACLLLPGLVLLGGCHVSKRVDHAGLPGGPVALPFAGPPVHLRVALAVEAPEQTMTCTGPWTVAASPGDPAPLVLEGGQPVVMKGREGRVHLERHGQAAPLALASPPGGSWIAKPVDPADHLLWDGRPWRGWLRVETAAPAGSLLTVVNLVELEDYLRGVVPVEMGRGRQPGELAALAAQAVAARTYAVARHDERRQQVFDLHADVRDQVYGGLAVEDSLCSLAVAITAGLVLRRGPGQSLADPFYHSTCGGHTASNSQVWPVAGDPLLRGVSDRRRDGRSWCAESRYHAWSERWSWAELQRVLARTLPSYLDYVSQPARAAWAVDAFVPARPGADGRAPGPLYGLNITARTLEGRAAVLEIVTEAGRYRVRGDQTRRVLQPASGNPPILRSAWFDLELSEGRAVVASGRGWGHGIGMCQMGALGRARHGQRFDEILAHYYPGSVLAQLVEVLP